MGTQNMFLDPALILTMLIAILNSGVRDLVGLMPVDDYWKAKHVTVSAGQMARELEPVKDVDVSALIAQLDADNPTARDEATAKIAAIGLPARSALEKAAKEGTPETAARANALLGKIRVISKPWSVRRLMAIRTLGQRKEKQSLEILRPLLESKEPFEPEYARAAIGEIEGRNVEAIVASDAERAADVALLPAQLDAVAQIALSGNSTISIDKVLEPLPVPDDQKKNMREEALGWLLKAMDTSGNVRLDAITVGFYAAPPGVPGNFAYIVRGEFDPAALSALLATFFPKTSKVDGGDLFTINEDSALLVTSNRRIIYLVREPMGELGLEAIEQGLKRGAGDFADNPDLPKLMKSVDLKSPFWSAMRFNPGMREVAGALGGFETATIVGTRSVGADNKPLVNLRAEAVSSDVAVARQAAAALDGEMKAAVAEGREAQKTSPVFKPMVDFAASVKVNCDGGKATITATAPEISLIFPIIEGAQIAH